MSRNYLDMFFAEIMYTESFSLTVIVVLIPPNHFFPLGDVKLLCFANLLRWLRVVLLHYCTSSLTHRCCLVTARLHYSSLLYSDKRFLHPHPFIIYSYTIYNSLNYVIIFKTYTWQSYYAIMYKVSIFKEPPLRTRKLTWRYQLYIQVWQGDFRGMNQI